MAFNGQEFGRRLGAARARAGLKPKQVAIALGASTEKVNRWERGDLVRPPSRGDLRLLAELLKQDEAWLVDGEGELRHPGERVASDVDEEAFQQEVRAELAAIHSLVAELLAAARGEAPPQDGDEPS